MALAAGAVAQVAMAAPSAPRVKYQIDPRNSQAVVQTMTKGASGRHDHHIEAGGVTGSISFVPYVPDTASLEIHVPTIQLRLADPDVTPDDRRRIEAWIHRALQSERYKEIVFRSSALHAEPLGDRAFDVTLTGSLDLRGRQNPVTVSAQVFIGADRLKAEGTFRLRQSDFRIPLASVGDGTISVDDDVMLSFAISAVSTR
jgi:polyisoprenoid-binding protein YceI